MTAASTASKTCGTCISSTSNAAKPARRAPASAATSPASMLAPSALVATGPRVASAAAVIRVVVDLPFVPVTTTERLPWPSWRSSDLSSVIATRPPIIAPAPRPVTRDAQRAADPAPSATRPRVVTIRSSLKGQKSTGDTRRCRSGDVRGPCHPRNVSTRSGGRRQGGPGADRRASPARVGPSSTSRRRVFTRARHASSASPRWPSVTTATSRAPSPACSTPVSIPGRRTCTG